MWARVDDGWWCHPKVMGLDLAARGLWITALCWASTQDTDVVPEAFLRMLGDQDGEALDLVEAGLWRVVEGGWQIVPWQEISPAKRRPNIPFALRAEVYERDGHQCLQCGATEDLTLDHIVPYSLGGPDTFENLRTLCRSCNSRRGAPCPG